MINRADVKALQAEGLKAASIARRLGCTRERIRQILEDEGLPTKKPRMSAEERNARQRIYGERKRRARGTPPRRKGRLHSDRNWHKKFKAGFIMACRIAEGSPPISAHPQSAAYLAGREAGAVYLSAGAR